MSILYYIFDFCLGIFFSDPDAVAIIGALFWAALLFGRVAVEYRRVAAESRARDKRIKKGV